MCSLSGVFKVFFVCSVAGFEGTRDFLDLGTGGAGTAASSAVDEEMDGLLAWLLGRLCRDLPTDLISVATDSIELV